MCTLDLSDKVLCIGWVDGYLVIANNLSFDDVLPFNKFKITHIDVQKKADILDTRYLDLFRCYSFLWIQILILKK